MASCVSCEAEPRGCGWLGWIPGVVLLGVVVVGVGWWLSTQEKEVICEH